MKQAKRAANRGVRLLLTFILGQVVQIILHATCMDFWEQYQLPFCIAGGFLVAVAVLAGMRIGVKEAEREANGTRWEDMQ